MTSMKQCIDFLEILKQYQLLWTILLMSKVEITSMLLSVIYNYCFVYSLIIKTNINYYCISCCFAL